MNQRLSNLLGIFQVKKKADIFGEYLCEALVRSDIPLYKVRNPAFVSFLEKYTQHKIPSETTLRNKHINKLYNECIDNIKNTIKNRFLWLSVLDRANHSTIARLFDDSLKILGEGFNKDAILLLLSDAAPYMVKAAKAIQIFYPKITHVTCLAHGFHRVCEQIRNIFPKVDCLISNIKKVFLKAPSRIEIFKNLEPELDLPPEPIITRWGTWLEAVGYYANNFEKIVRIFESLDKEDAASINNSKNLLQDTSIKNELIFIESNYSFLVNSIRKLESTGLALVVQVKVVTDAIDSINAVQGTKGDTIKKKLNSVLEKNVGFNIMKNISNSMTEEKYTTRETLAFKYAPITSVDVERSFSIYKNVFRANRQCFLFENLREILAIYCNQNAD
jgi:hypothetical protein